jgi:hypothetical protein
MIHKVASIKPTKVTKEDIELADEISLVTSIKDAVGHLTAQLENEFALIEGEAESGTPVATYKQILSSRAVLREAVNALAAGLLVGLGDIEPADAKELSDPEVAKTAGTMDAALENFKEPTVEIPSEEN